MSAQSDQSQLTLLLKNLMGERTLSIRKLSEMTHIDAATISRILNGKRRANADHLLKFAACLDVSSEQLFNAAGYTIEQSQDWPVSDIHSSVDMIETVLIDADIHKPAFSLDDVRQLLETHSRYSQVEEGRERVLNGFEDKLKKVGGVGPFIVHMKEMFERFRTGKGTTSELMIMGGALLYFIISVDVIPDYTFPLGYIDDAIAVKLTLHSLSAKT